MICRGLRRAREAFTQMDRIVGAIVSEIVSEIVCEIVSELVRRFDSGETDSRWRKLRWQTGRVWHGMAFGGVMVSRRDARITHTPSAGGMRSRSVIP